MHLRHTDTVTESSSSGSIGAKFGNFGVGLAGAQKEVNNVKRKAYFPSGSAAAGAGTIYPTLTQDDQDTDLDNTGLGLTYSHGLSKRTFLQSQQEGCAQPSESTLRLLADQPSLVWRGNLDVKRATI